MKKETKEWSLKNKFPPVGEVVNFWDDVASNYRKGTVVYSGEKGATVDVGCLMTSGEAGDFSEFNEEDQKKLDAIDAIKELVKNPHDLTQTAEKIYDAIHHGKIVIPVYEKGHNFKWGYTYVGDIVEYNFYDYSHDNWQTVKILAITSNQIAIFEISSGVVVLERSDPHFRKIGAKD